MFLGAGHTPDSRIMAGASIPRTTLDPQPWVNMRMEMKTPINMNMVMKMKAVG